MIFYDRVRPVKEREVEALRGMEEELSRTSAALPPVCSLSKALQSKDPAIIAEIKRASPSKGIFAADLNASEQALAYKSGGAAALSVLTEEEFFHGSLEDISAVKEVVSIPVLRKDFILDKLQITAARASGADAVLLIVGFLSCETLCGLLEALNSLGMEAIVEVHDEKELRTAVGAGAGIIGINNRNLKNLTVDLAVSEELLPLVPDNCLTVVESGIHGRADIERLQKAGAGAFLIGEHLVRSENPEQALRELSGG